MNANVLVFCCFILSLFSNTAPPSGASSVLQNYERALRKALGVEKEAIENSTIRVCPCV